MSVKFKWETEFKETEIGEIPKDNSYYITAKGVVGLIPKDWNMKKIKNKFKVNTGKRISSQDEGKYSLYCANGFSGFSNKFLTDGEAIVTGRVGTLGQVFYVCGKIDISDNAFFITPKDKEAHLKFLYYSVKHVFKHIEEVLNVGTSQPLIKQSELKDFSIPFPDLNEQSRIATVLSWFDNLIENKKRQNEILEKVAMAIFKSWFVDFEPFKDEEFVYNEELGKEIPKGWEVKPIGEVADFVKGLSYRSNELVNNPTEGEIFITLKIFKRGGGFRPEYKYYKGNRYSEEQVVYDGDLVIALTDMTSDAKVVGAPALVILPPDRNKGILSLDAVKLNTPQYMKEYVYLYLKDSQEENSTFANGVNVLHLNLNLFKVGKFILIPPQPIIQRFHSLVEPLFQKIILNQKQIMVLRKIRDTLLPKLIFGKLRVEEI